MRALALLAVVLLPIAAAQVGLPPPVELRAEEPPLVRPLQGVVTSNVTVRVSCTLTGGAGVNIAYRVDDAPAWSAVTISPASDVANLEMCKEGYAERHATLAISASDQSPAFSPEGLTLSVTVGDPPRQEEASVVVPLTADYHSLLDISLAETTKVVAPGDTARFPIKLTNLGNGKTRVRMILEDATEGLVVGPPGPVELGSRQQGAAATSTTVEVAVRADARGLYVNQVGVVNLRIVPEHAGEPPRAGEEGSISLLLTTKTGGGEGARVPLPVALALVAVALASGLKGRLRS